MTDRNPDHPINAPGKREGGLGSLDQGEGLGPIEEDRSAAVDEPPGALVTCPLCGIFHPYDTGCPVL